MKFRTTLSLILTGVSLGLVLAIAFLILHGKYGHDAHIYCQAASAAAYGNDPYATKAAGSLLPWVYQPIYLQLAGLLCAPPLNLEKNYPLLYTLLLVVSTMLWASRKEWGSAILISLVAFVGFSWILYTGNFAIIEFFLLSCGFALLKKRKWDASAALFGLAASLKLIPIVYLLLFLCIPSTKSARIRAILVGLLAFAAPLALSAIFYPHLMQPFVMQVFGAASDQHKVLQDTAGLYDPSFTYFIAQLLNLDPLKFAPLFAVILAGVGASFLVIVYNKIKPLETDVAFYQFFAFAFLVVALILPRAKPYSFVMLAPAVYWLIEIKHLSFKNAIWITALFLPALALLLNIAFGRQDITQPTGRFILLDYSQTLTVLLTIIVAYVHLYAGKMRPQNIGMASQ